MAQRRTRVKKAQEEPEEEQSVEEQEDEELDDDLEDEEIEDEEQDEEPEPEEEPEEEGEDAGSGPLADVNLAITETTITISMPRNGQEEEAIKRLGKLIRELNK